MAETIEDLLSNLSLKSGNAGRGRSISSLQETLENLGFTIFEPLKDLGYFGWNPSVKGADVTYKTTLEEVTEIEIKEHLDPTENPPASVPISSLRRQLPLQFKDLSSKPQSHMNRYPYSNYYIGTLHVAVEHRGLDLDQTDFYFGGSALEALAQCTTDRDYVYLALLVPGSNKTIMLFRHKEYEQNYADPGFQFERLCTGRRMEDRHDEVVVEHMTEMMVGPYRVFFEAESDAIDTDSGMNIEIKASNPRYWGTRVMFQMISSSSLHLYAGHKARRSLVGVQCQTLEEVGRKAFASTSKSRKELESNIVRCMRTLKEEYLEVLQSGYVYRLTFERSEPKLDLYSKSNSKIFPPENVIEKLLG